MKRIKRIVFIIVLGLLINPFFLTVKAEDPVDIYFFYDDFCLGCQDMEAYFNESLLEEYPEVTINYYNLGTQEAQDLFEEVRETFSINYLTPTVIIGGVAFQGHSSVVEKNIEYVIDYYKENTYVDITDKLIDKEAILDTDFDEFDFDHIVEIPIFGFVEAESISVIIAAVLLGFVDGLNPCAMWVLVFLLSMLIGLKNRKRMWAIGLTFLITSAIMYFGILLAINSVADVFAKASSFFRTVVIVFAIVFGIYSVYKYIKNRKEDIGCEVTNDKQRSKIIERIKTIVYKDNLILALIGTVLLAVIVNLIDVACTAALPLTFDGILALYDFNFLQRLFYIAVYVLFFLIDDLIIFSIAMVTLKVTGISNKYANFSKLVGGILMLAIGVLLYFNVI